MYKTPEETRAYIREFLPLISAIAIRDTQVVLFPPAYNISAAVDALGSQKNIYIGVQNISDKTEGAYTGENSVAVMKALGATHVLVGHSERRELFGESNEACLKKIRLSMELGLVPILCVGEKLTEREAGKTWSVIQQQLDSVFHEIPATADVVVAYEPVWAIGTGRVATPAQAEEVHGQIRQHLKRDLTILYGGSVKPENAQVLIEQHNIDGFLVGGASLKPTDFFKIITG